MNTGSARQKALRWYKHLRETSNDAFMPLYFDKSRYMALMGGAGSGKSVFAARKVLERARGERGGRLLVCRKVGKSLRQSCFALLRAQIAEHYPRSRVTVRLAEPHIRFEGGGEILFCGLDNTEKLKSIHALSGIWAEEATELTERDFLQLDLRLRGDVPGYKQFILTFNPVSAAHWLKGRFFDNPRPDTALHRSTYRDNRFIDGVYGDVLESLRGEDDYFHGVYADGNWGFPGGGVFDAAAVHARMAALAPSLKTGFFEGGHWQDSREGHIKIYAEPLQGGVYCLGGDTAGEGSDFFTAQVIDAESGRQVACLRRRFDEDVYARQVYELGRYYNNALAGIETNFSTYPVKELARMGYARQYVRETEDSFTGRARRSYGVKTTALTRPVMLAGLVAALREDMSLVSDELTLCEMLTFRRNERLRPEAAAGAHDDLVMALAMAHYIRPQALRARGEPPAPGEGWSEDMEEDFHAASSAAREYLLSKWGG
ncbi:MAG: PBSX family phage terminase large subunit [Oscillospiraceae bacterium]|jgi:phage terminase large subunit|nr:PBSX family phage terminase large subunit [Oscillospiraceae bacterium]